MDWPRFVTSLTGTANQVTVSAAVGDVTLSLPQSIATGSSVTFANVTDTALTSGRVVIAGASGILANFSTLTFDGNVLTLAGSNSGSEVFVISNTAASTGRGLKVSAGATASDTILRCNNKAVSIYPFDVCGNGDVIVNASGTAFGTTSTDGFFFISTCAGVPTGVPTSDNAGSKAMRYDTTNNKIWVYNGAWRGIVVV